MGNIGSKNKSNNSSDDNSSQQNKIPSNAVISGKLNDSDQLIEGAEEEGNICSITYIQVKEALKVYYDNHFNNQFEDITNNILSFISVNGLYIHDRCKYNPKTNEFEISFQNACGDVQLVENHMKIKLEESIFKELHQILSKLDVYSFPIYVTKSGYLFITQVPFLQKQFTSSNDNYQQFESNDAIMFMKSAHSNVSYNILHSKIVENKETGKIHIDSTFSICSLQSDYDWRKNYLISNIWGLIHIAIGNYKQKTSVVTIELTKEMYEENVINQLLSVNDKRNFTFLLDFKMDYGGVQCFTKIYLKQHLIECGVIKNGTDNKNIECMAVLNQFKIQFYELPNGNLIDEYHIKNLSDKYHILAYNINETEKYLILIVKDKKGGAKRFHIDRLGVMYFNINTQKVMKMRYLQKHSESEIVKKKYVYGARYLPDVEYWKCQQIIDVKYGYDNLFECFVWNLYIEFGDGASEPGRFEMKITLKGKNLKELNRICGPRIRNYACSDYKESDGDVEWIKKSWKMNSTNPILVSSSHIE